MKILLMIGTGSFAGGILRYLISQFLQGKTASTFPIGTLLVNIVGCFLVGLIVGVIDRGTLASEWRLFLITGLLGGFTTFSAFSMESVSLLREGQVGYALTYIGLSVCLGLFATYIAYSMTACRSM